MQKALSDTSSLGVAGVVILHEPGQVTAWALNGAQSTAWAFFPLCLLSRVYFTGLDRTVLQPYSCQVNISKPSRLLHIAPSQG